jgi:cell division protein FtsQ
VFKSRKAILIPAAVVVLLAVIVCAGFYLKKTYTVENVYVEGNVHYTEDEIKAIVMSGALGDNSLYLSLKYRNKGVEGIPFVDVMDVSVLAPDTIKITVYEKALTGYVKYLDTYMYFDKDGYVVESSSVKTAGIPQITGLEFDYIVLGEQLPVEDEDVFGSILDITKLLQKYDLDSEKIYINKSGEITLYFGEVKVALGNDRATLEDKLMLLPSFLPSLEGKTGTLQMQTFDESGGKYVFKPE